MDRDRMVVNEYGMLELVSDITGMMFPYRCVRCDHVHDVANVTVIARYVDCSVWKCPNCQATIDDRPVGWGGSAEPIRK